MLESKNWLKAMYLRFSAIFNMIVNSGLTGNENFIERRQVNLTNYAILISFACFLGFGFYLLFQDIVYASTIGFGGAFFNLIAYFLVNQKKHLAGYMVLLIGNLILYDAMGIIYGRYSGGYFLLILWLFAIATISGRVKLFIALFILGVISYIGIEFINLNYGVIIPLHVKYQYLYYMIVFMGTVFLFGIVEFILSIQLSYQNELKEKNNQLKKYFTAIEQNHATIIITDEKGKIQYANPQFEKGTGYFVDDVIGSNPRFLKSGKTPEHTFSDLWKTITSGKVWRGEFVNLKKDQSEYIEKAIISPITNHLGEIVNYVAVKEDITEAKKAEELLRISEIKLARLLEKQTVKVKDLSDRLRYIYNNSVNAVAFFDIDGERIRFSSCNRLWSQSIGYEPEEIEGADISGILDEKILGLYYKYLNKAIESNSIIQEYVLFENKYLYIIVTPIKDKDLNKVTSCASFIYNVTEKYETELKLKESEEKFFTIFNTNKDSIAVISTDFEIVEANDHLKEFFGFKTSKKDLLGSKIDIRKFIPLKYHSAINERLQRLLNGEKLSTFECEFLLSNGRLVPIEMDNTIFILKEIPLILCISRDISIRKNLERKLAQVAISIENRERRNLATDLHDNVGPLLSSMNMCLSLLSRKDNMNDHLEDISNIKKILKEAMTSVREISNNLSPQVLINYGLASALEVYFETKKQLFDIELIHNITNLRFEETKEVMIYNIIKEAFNNTVKYSKATRVKLNLLCLENNITLIYEDNGIGFNLEEKLSTAGTNLGLFSIINRVRNLNGEYSIKTSPDNGFMLEVMFSIKNEDEQDQS